MNKQQLIDDMKQQLASIENDMLEYSGMLLNSSEYNYLKGCRDMLVIYISLAESRIIELANSE